MKPHSLRALFTFGIKCAAALLLAALADRLFFGNEPGSTIGVFAFAWAVLLVFAQRTVWKSRPAQIGLFCAALMSVVLFDNPGPLAWLLFWAALSSAVLLSYRGVRDTAHLAVRLFLHGFVGLGALARDGLRLLHLPRANLKGRLSAALAMLVVPLAGGAIFLLLFIQANPVMAWMMPHLTIPEFDGGRLIFWLLILVVVWPSLRPSRLALRFELPAAPQALILPGVTLASITISLVLFNLLFTVQNTLDIIFLWSGAALPGELTMAQYAHRGAYPLIVTALLAGGFVLLAAQPDTEIGRSPLIRKLVVLWIGQNLVLVASSIVRTVNYVDSYVLTEMRAAALLWMLLVAAGLVLICWRLLMHRPLAWLINRLAAGAVLTVTFALVIDLAAVSAAWNVRHAREAGGQSQPLDLAYMRSLGSAAIVPLAQLEQMPLHPGFRDRVVFTREILVANAQSQQAQPHGWVWREARRLETAKAILGSRPDVSRRAPAGREADGRIKPVPQRAPLTLPVDQ